MKTRTLVLAIALALAVWAFLSWCTPRTVEAADRGVQKPYRSSFSFTAKDIQGPCFHSRHWWGRENLTGTLAYAIEYRVWWCQNWRGTRITSVDWTSVCLNGGGYYVFEGCTSQRTTPFGYDHVDLAFDWRFSDTKVGVTNWKTPYIRMKVGLDGHVSGTLYLDPF